MLRRILMIVLGMGVSGALAQAPAQPVAQAAAADVPVKEVVLFSSGVGYFEHAGTVRGNGTTELRFKTNQINDILKSLVLQDMDGGKVSTIQYPSQDPVAKTLRSFQVDITNNPPLADLLNQLRGAKVTVTIPAEKLTGTVLGVETKQRPAGDRGVVSYAVMNLLTGATIRSIELDTVSGLVLEDQQLQEELTKALAALAQSRDQDKKPVTINFQGEGERRVRIGYVVETPIWKTSYRLILGGPKSTDGQLQGWAIVENQTESDWNNVQLSLVSGRPISFVMDLYQPLYATRPTVVQELFAGLRPRTYDAGLAENLELGRFAAATPAPAAPPGARGGGGGFGGGGGGGGRGGRAGAPQQQLQQAEQQRMRAQSGEELDGKLLDVTASVQSLASASKIGELFQYTVGNVTLPRQKSAMLPIITDKIEVERLSIYNASVLPRNPLNGARVKNTTDKHLLQGPVTVLDANSYAGDAQIDNVPPGQERLLSYGVDLEMLVDSTKNTSTDSILTGKIVKGVLEISRKHVFSQDYVSENKGAADRTLIIEHPIRQGWKLVGTETKPIETTATLYRFKGTVPAKKATKLTVQEEIVNSETLAMLPADVGQLVFYSRTGEIPKGVRDALTKAIQMKDGMTDTQRQINERNQRLAEITQEQGRIRENMKTINQQTPLYNQLLTKLGTQETEIEKLQSERESLSKTLDGQRRELEGYLEGLNVG